MRAKASGRGTRVRESLPLASTGPLSHDHAAEETGLSQMTRGGGQNSVQDDRGSEEDGPQPPQSILKLSSQARKVRDADEETFLLYTLTPAPHGRLGLGSVNSNHDMLRIAFDLAGTEEPQVASVQTAEDEAPSSNERRKKPTTRRIKAHSQSQYETRASSGSLSVVIHQSSTSLRSTIGDTGSVIWRSSVRLAACLVRQLHKPLYGDTPPLLDLSASKPVLVLELGSGTGVLPALLLTYLSRLGTLGPIEWVATDQPEMIPLLDKNLARLRARLSGDGNKILARSRELDWIKCSQSYRSTSSYAGGVGGLRESILSDPGDRQPRVVDLLVAVDCVFNPSLFSPLIDTINAFTTPNHTVVLVLIELRSSDVTLQFLETWLGSSDDAGSSKWEIWSVAGDQLTCGLDKGYAAWIAWRIS